MSSQIYIQSFKEGNARAFKTDLLRTALGSSIRKEQSDIWEVRFSDTEEDGGEFFVSDPEQITGFTVERPLQGPALYEFIYALLTNDTFVAYAPGSPLLIGNTSTLAQVPAEMVEALGKPVVVSSGEEVRQKLFESV